jgi:hypothetical protein
MSCNSWYEEVRKVTADGTWKDFYNGWEIEKVVIYNGWDMQIMDGILKLRHNRGDKKGFFQRMGYTRGFTSVGCGRVFKADKTWTGNS